MFKPALAIRWLLAAAMALAPALQAAPANGYALFLGGVAARQSGISSTGFSLGADALFGVNPNLSLDPFLMISEEKSTTGPAQNLSDSLGGMQFRAWFGQVYLGPQIFLHALLMGPGGQVRFTRYGPGVGAVLGWEGPSGISAGLQLDALEDRFPEVSYHRNAVRAHVGYRWR